MKCRNCAGIGHWFRIERTPLPYGGVRKVEIKTKCVACGGTGRVK